MSSYTTSRASVIILVRSQAVHSCSMLLFLHSCQHYCSTVTFCSHNICCLIVSKGNFLLRKFFWGFCLVFFLINLTLDKCLTISHYKPISLCKASVSPKGPPSLIFPISIQSNNQFPLEISYPKSPTFEQLQSSFYTYLSRELPFCLFRSYFLLTHQLYESVLLDLCIILYKRHNLHVLLLVFIIYLQQIHLLYF